MKKIISSVMRKLNTPQIMAVSFALLIIVGGLILLLPFCAAPGVHTSFADAMFTSTTCVCVTGLSTVTMAAHWSLAGKIIILILIQIGGIGTIALASIIFIALRKKISLRNQQMIRESYNLDQSSGLTQIVRKVVLCVFGAEAVGAFFYSFWFIPRYGFVKGLAQAVFTAVSAFCNAGIDMMGDSSLANYVHDPWMNLITIALIIVSGLGFVVWWDLAGNVKKVLKGKVSPHRFFRTLRLQSKLVLLCTAVLVIGGTVLIFIFEYHNPDTMESFTLGEKLMASVFQSVTTRTAGFLTIDQGKLSTASVVLCLFLMFIGGSPMGTAGGVKTVTILLIFLAVFSNLKGKSETEIFNRRIRRSYIQSALVVTGMSFVTLFIMAIALAAAMPAVDLSDILYEITSAVATVGLSRGLTGELNLAGKWIVILTMYLGRIGPLTLGTAVLMRQGGREEANRLADEDIMVG